MFPTGRRTIRRRTILPPRRRRRYRRSNAERRPSCLLPPSEAFDFEAHVKVLGGLTLGRVLGRHDVDLVNKDQRSTCLKGVKVSSESFYAAGGVNFHAKRHDTLAAFGR